MRVLGEGIDVPNLDAVAFIDPKGSVIDIVQSIGRVLRRDPNNPDKIGTIIIPVFVDTDAENIHDELVKSVYRPIYRVLNVLRSIDERFAEQINGLRIEIGPPNRTHKPPVGLSPRLKIDIPSITGDILQAFEVRLVEGLSTSGEFWIDLLKQHVAEYGHANIPVYTGRSRVPRLYKGYPLGRWMANTRARKDTLSPDFIRRLNEIGFPWDLRDERWEKQFNQYLDHVERHGCHPTQGPEARWAISQRLRFFGKKGEPLTPDQVRSLEEIDGWSWDPLADDFEKTIQRFVQYVETHPNGRVPAKYKDAADGYALGVRIVTLRLNHRQHKLDPDKERRLEELRGWTWNPYAEEFEDVFQDIKEFAKHHGHIPRKGDVVNGRDLGVAVISFRSRAKKTTALALRAEQKDRLEKEIPGWTWDPFADLFEKNLQETKEFVKQHGRLPRQQKDGKPGRWLGHLREKKDNLGPERICRLDKEIPGWESPSR